MKEILKIQDLKLNYGLVSALKGVDLSVSEGQIVALLGANGAGKTTTLKAVSGLLKPSGGQILFEGQNIAGQSAHQIARRGIMQSPEGRHVLLGLTVEENLRVGAHTIRSKAQVNANFERVYQLFPRLKERAKQESGTLSGGEYAYVLELGKISMHGPAEELLHDKRLIEAYLGG